MNFEYVRISIALIYFYSNEREKSCGKKGAIFIKNKRKEIAKSVNWTRLLFNFTLMRIKTPQKWPSEWMLKKRFFLLFVWPGDIIQLASYRHAGIEKSDRAYHNLIASVKAVYSFCLFNGRKVRKETVGFPKKMSLRRPSHT